MSSPLSLACSLVAFVLASPTWTSAALVPNPIEVLVEEAAQTPPVPPTPPTPPTPAVPHEAARVGQEAARAAAEAARAVRESLKGLEHQLWVEGKGEPFTENVTKVLKTSGPVTLVVRNFAGDISVKATPGNEVRIGAVKRARAKDASAAKPVLEATEILIEQQGDRIEVRVPVPKWREERRAMASVSFDIGVPANAGVEIKTVSGDVSLAGVKGVVAAESVSGTITASGLAGQASLRSVSGDVHVNGSAVSGDVTVNSVSGDVTARALKARGVTASTVSGDIRLQDASCDRATVKSMSGDVEIAGSLNRSARYELKSHSGDVRVVVDGKTGFELDATTWSGDLSSDVKLVSAAAVERDSPGMRRRALQGVFGDGSARIEATSFSGSVFVAGPK